MPLSGLEWGFLTLLTTLTGLLSAYIVFRVIKPRLKRTIQGYIPVVANAIEKKMAKMGEEALKNIDLGGIGAEGGSLGDIGDLLSGDQGGIGQLLKLFSQFSGKGSNKGGKMGL